MLLALYAATRVNRALLPSQAAVGSKAMLAVSKTMKKEDLNQKRVCESGPEHHEAAPHLTHMHSVLNSCQNHSSSLQELFYFTVRSCSLFNTIPLPLMGKEMPPSLRESAGRNSSAAAPWKDLFHLRSSSGKDSLDRVSRCINSISVTDWPERGCSFAEDFSPCCPGGNVVCFADFWLGNLQLLELDMSSSKGNELQLAFLKELELGGLPDLYSIPVASLKKYAMGLFNNQKPCFFLCYLNLVSSEQTLGYKQMLLRIQYVSNNFHIIQVVISVLAFALAGLWYAVVNVKKY